MRGNGIRRSIGAATYPYGRNRIHDDNLKSEAIAIYNPAIFMGRDIRVRYAPSPTGMQHIGGIRTALFNYFFAKSHGGSFILRIEDTDRNRFHPDALQDIYDTFEWLGIEADESPARAGAVGPYVQSERVDLYRSYADQLVEDGYAYLDYSSADRDTGEGYDYAGREMKSDEIERRIAAGVQPVVR